MTWACIYTLYICRTLKLFLSDSYGNIWRVYILVVVHMRRSQQPNKFVIYKWERGKILPVSFASEKHQLLCKRSLQLLLIYLPVQQIDKIVGSCYMCFFNFLSARTPPPPLHQVVKIVTMVSEALNSSNVYNFKVLFCELQMINHKAYNL